MGLERTIAILHRDPAIVDMLAALVKTESIDARKMTVSETTSPQDVVSFVDTHNPHLLVLPVNYQAALKKEEGFQALAEVRKTRPTLPVIMISGGGSEYRDRAMQLGTDYLAMPFNFEQFMEIVRSRIQS